MPLILPGNVSSATAGAYSVANSCIFNDGDSAYMHKALGTEGDVKTRGLKYNLIQDLKITVSNELAKTDWYVVRKADAGTAVPSAITNHRAAVRTKCAEMETAITNASDTPALETLYTRNNSGVRPLGDLPTLEV